MVQVFDYNLIAYITLRTFPKMNLNKKFIQGLVIGSSKDSKKINGKQINEKQNIPHCRNNSKIKYQNCRKRKHRY